MRGARGAGGALAAAVLLAAAGCASVSPFPPVPLLPVAAADEARLYREGWTESGKSWRLRGAALLRRGGFSQSCDFLVELDTAKGEGRAAFLADSGVKLFEASFSAAAASVAAVAGDSPRLRPLGAAAATALRRIFADGRADGALARGPDHFQLLRREGERETRFLFGGPDLALLTKSSTGGGEEWSASYYRHAPAGGLLVPRGLFYLDRGSGFSLILWLTEVEEE